MYRQISFITKKRKMPSTKKWKVAICVRFQWNKDFPFERLHMFVLAWWSSKNKPVQTLKFPWSAIITVFMIKSSHRWGVLLDYYWKYCFSIIVIYKLVIVIGSPSMFQKISISSLCSRRFASSSHLNHLRRNNYSTTTVIDRYWVPIIDISLGINKKDHIEFV